MNACCSFVWNLDVFNCHRCNHIKTANAFYCVINVDWHDIHCELHGFNGIFFIYSFACAVCISGYFSWFVFFDVCMLYVIIDWILNVKKLGETIIQTYRMYGILAGIWNFAPGSKSISDRSTGGLIPPYFSL